jgi:hypothetical protein
MQRKMLPIGVQTLKEIRQDGTYYVDKTPFAVQLVNEGKAYFLSRPRRFGKSLFLDTLKELFEGNQSLFQGLYAERHWDWSVRHPVLRLSFAEGVLHTPEDFEASVHGQLLDFDRPPHDRRRNLGKLPEGNRKPARLQEARRGGEHVSV